MTSLESLRIIIAEDQEYLREGIKQTLSARPGIEVVGTASDGLQAVQITLDLNPNVALLDIHMPNLNGIEAAQRIRAERPNIGILLLSQYDDLAYVRRFLGSDTGHKGYLLKSTLGAVDTLVQAIRGVAAGQLVLDPQLAEALLQNQSPVFQQLTNQERRILASMAQGLDNQAIAETLTVEKSTVENHINSIYSKLDIGMESGQHRRVKAVLRFLNGS